MLFVTGLLTGILFALMGITAVGYHVHQSDERRIEKEKYEEGKLHGSRNQKDYIKN